MAWLVPDWPASARVQAASLTRRGGVSVGGYAGLNLSAGVGDSPGAVRRNRALLCSVLDLPREPLWLSQVHGKRVVDAAVAEEGVEADAAVCAAGGAVCAVLTADCLPVLFCDLEGARVGAAHAGWRGLVSGVLEATVEALGGSGGTLMAWLGPAIGPGHFEVGREVRDAFMARSQANGEAFRAASPGRWLADLYSLARNELRSLGVAVYGGGLSTYEEPGRFYSYRRQNPTGRMASLIWLVPD